MGTLWTLPSDVAAIPGPSHVDDSALVEHMDSQASLKQEWPPLAAQRHTAVLDKGPLTKRAPSTASSMSYMSQEASGPDEHLLRRQPLHPQEWKSRVLSKPSVEHMGKLRQVTADVYAPPRPRAVASIESQLRSRPFGWSTAPKRGPFGGGNVTGHVPRETAGGGGVFSVRGIQPSEVPKTAPGIQPSEAPETAPGIQPSEAPKTAPGVQPSVVLKTVPGMQPSEVPGALPSELPREQPREASTKAPRGLPNDVPSGLPRETPIKMPGDPQQHIASDAFMESPGYKSGTVNAAEGRWAEAPSSASSLDTSLSLSASLSLSSGLRSDTSSVITSLDTEKRPYASIYERFTRREPVPDHVSTDKAAELPISRRFARTLY